MGTALTNYRVSSDYEGDGAAEVGVAGSDLPEAGRLQGRGAGDFQRAQDRRFRPRTAERIKNYREVSGRKAFQQAIQRMGWQPRCKPTVLSSGRILLPLYSDTFSFSIMAISDDDGQTLVRQQRADGLWQHPAGRARAERRLAGGLHARERPAQQDSRQPNRPTTASPGAPVGTIDLPNPGSGLDAVRLANGHWVLIYNDTLDSRNSLAVSISEDEGKTWPITRHLEKHEEGALPLPGHHPRRRRHDARHLQLLRRRRQDDEARRLQRRLDSRRRREITPFGSRRQKPQRQGSD